MLITCIIQVLLFITHLLIIYSLVYFLINPLFYPLWMVNANFIFILIVISSYFCSVWHPFGCFILRMRHVFFKLFNLKCVAFTLHIFTMFIPRCKYFFFFFLLSSCTRNLAHKSQCCKYSLTLIAARTDNARAHAQYGKCLFWSEILKI